VKRIGLGAWLLVMVAGVVAPDVVLAAQGGAQPPTESRPMRGRPGRGMPPRPANPDMMTVPQVEQYFDQFVLFQAQSRLELSDAQFLRFGAALRQLQTTRRTQQRQRMASLQQLNALLAAAEPDDAQIAARIKDVDDLNAEGLRRLQQAYAGIDEVLNLRQRARFRVFEENMERRKLDLLARARQQAGAPGPQAPPPR